MKQAIHARTALGRRTVATVLAASALALAAGAGPARAAGEWPAEPITIVVAYPAGGGTDIQARLLAKNFYESMKQTFLVDNRSGAGGIIGAELAVRSPADGYTILFTTASIAVNVTLYGKRVKFDPLKDLRPVC